MRPIRSTLSDYGPSDVALSFLPLAHVYERTLDYVYLFSGVSIAYVDAPERLPQALLEVRPTISRRGPAHFRKTLRQHHAKGPREHGREAPAFRLGHRRGQPREAVERLRQARRLGVETGMGSADKIVFSKIRAGLGGRIREFISGGAPLAPELAEFFWAIGIPVYQGYGLTETSPVIAVNIHEANKLGTVGRPDCKRRGAHRRRRRNSRARAVRDEGLLQGPAETRRNDFAGWLAGHRRYRPPG